MDIAVKRTLLAENESIILWFMKQRMHPYEIAIIGGYDDTKQELRLVFFDACDEAERRGITITTAFVRLARFRMNRIKGKGFLVTPPEHTHNLCQETVEKARRARCSFRPVTTAAGLVSYDNVWDIDGKDDSSHIARRLREILTPRELDVVTRYFGLFGARRETFESISGSLGKSRQRICQIVQESLKKLRKCESLRDLVTVNYPGRYKRAS